MRAARKPRPCVICGQPFTPLGASHAICSAECRSEDSRQRSVAWHITRGTMQVPDPEQALSTCESCGKTFKRRYNAKTCSWGCKQVRRQKLKRERARETQGAELRSLVAIKRCEAPIPEPVRPPGLACYSCANWRAMPESDTGGACTREVFRTCGPYGDHPRFFERIR